MTNQENQSNQNEEQGSKRGFRKHPATTYIPARVRKRIFDEYFKIKITENNPDEVLRKVALGAGASSKTVRIVLSEVVTRDLAVSAKQEIMDRVVREKVPILKEIVGYSLEILKEFLLDLNTNKTKRDKLTILDARGLSGIAKDCNELLRLELGESTQNVAVVNYSFEQTKDILDDLRKIDPIFEYPELKKIDEK